MYYGWKMSQVTEEKETTPLQKILAALAITTMLSVLIFGIPIYSTGGTPLETKEGVVTHKSQHENKGSISSSFDVDVDGKSRFYNIGNTVYTTFEVGDKILLTEYYFGHESIKTLRLGTPEQKNKIVKVN